MHHDHCCHRHGRLFAYTFFLLLLIGYLITVMALAPWSATTSAELWQSGDAVLLQNDQDLYESVGVSQYEKFVANNSRDYWLATYRTLPPMYTVARDTSIKLDMPKYTWMDLPFRMNQGSSFVINWTTSQSINFYIFDQSEYNRWSAPDDDSDFYNPDISSSTKQTSSSTSTTPSSPQLSPKISQKGRSGLASYTAAQTGLFYLVWDCSDCRSLTVGHANVSASLRQYNVTSNPCADAVQCCSGTSHALGTCLVSWPRSPHLYPILSIPSNLSDDFYTELDVSVNGRYGFYFGVTLGSLGALLVVLLAIVLLVRAWKHHRGHLYQYEQY